MSGWFAVKHGIRKHPIFKGRPERLGAWVAMLDEAAWKDVTQDVRGVDIVVKRGQLCASQSMLMDMTGLTRQKLRDFLDDLEEAGAIARNPTQTSTQKKTKTRTLITFCNYDKYQMSGDVLKPSEKPKTQPIKEQVNNIPVGTADKSASSDVVDLSSPNAVVWAIGRAYLTPFVGSKKAGPIIGKWLKADEPAAVITAIEAAKKAGTQDPVPYITQALKPKHIRERNEQRRVQNAWLGLPADA